MRSLEQTSSHGGNHILYAELLNLSDELLMQELQMGNTDAFAVLFKRYHRLIHVIALRTLRDAGEAEDLTQAIFLEAYRNAGQFDSAKGTLKGWLLRYAYSRSINRLNYLMVRQFGRQAELGEVEEMKSLWSPAQLPVQEKARLTSEVLAALPEAQKQTIEMFFFEGMTLKEIAQRRNETFSNVRHHYYRGLDHLRCLLENGLESESPKESVVPGGEA
jgi:RNA polymerase sigma-70 factor (ECF subfamily)